ncbi:hypothetical protein KY289_001149 [Solanum tuberosum]|nr:hypothetical protein KY289_001149 [Solanum tuberosum]
MIKRGILIKNKLRKLKAPRIFPLEQLNVILQMKKYLEGVNMVRTLRGTMKNKAGINERKRSCPPPLFNKCPATKESKNSDQGTNTSDIPPSNKPKNNENTKDHDNSHQSQKLPTSTPHDLNKLTSNFEKHTPNLQNKQHVQKTPTETPIM